MKQIILSTLVLVLFAIGIVAQQQNPQKPPPQPTIPTPRPPANPIYIGPVEVRSNGVFGQFPDSGTLPPVVTPQPLFMILQENGSFILLEDNTGTNRLAQEHN